jgi:serine/threonine-protein kinase
VHQGVLFAVRFDLTRLQTRGSPVPVLEDLAANPLTGGGQFAFSNTGTFLYIAGKVPPQRWRVVWLDGSGTMQPLIPDPGTYGNLSLSPDGRKLAFIDSHGDIHVYDIERETTTRLTFSGGSSLPVWSPDGQHIAFGQGQRVYWIRSNVAVEPTLLWEHSNVFRPWSFSPGGRWLACFERSAETGFDLSLLPLDLSNADLPKVGKPETFLRTPIDETVPEFSPDGRWIAYRCNDSGRAEICVRAFHAEGGARWQVSTGGGLFPFWSRNGNQLFYEAIDNRIMVVDYTLDGASFIAGRPRLWSDKPLVFFGTINISLAPDGKRFAALSMPETSGGEKGSVHVTMLLNFFDELKRRVP